MDKVVDFIFSFKEEEKSEGEEGNEEKEGLGYGSANFIKTIAFALFALIFVILIIVLSIVIRNCIVKHGRCLLILKFVIMIKNKLMFNAIIRSFLQGYL